LNFRSSASDIFKAMDELRLAIPSVIKEADVEGKAAAHGEDVGGPHAVAVKNIAMTLILRKLWRDKPLDYKSRVEVDIDGGQSQDIRLLVGGMAQREIQQD
jgi:hypothetical protein